MTKIDDLIAAGTITLTRAEFEELEAALIEASKHMHGFTAIDQALAILSKHGGTKIEQLKKEMKDVPQEFEEIFAKNLYDTLA